MSRPKDKSILYMVIDPDDVNELPLFCGTAEEVAEWCNTTVVNIRSAICHAKRRNQKSKYVRVELQEE